MHFFLPPFWHERKLFFQDFYTWVIAVRMLMILPRVWFPPLFFPIPFYFSTPSATSAVTGTYLWDICRKVGISMWKGSCRQCYALCIHRHLYEMQPLSFLLACNLVAIFQGGSWGGGGGTIEGRHVSYSYTYYSCAPCTWNSPPRPSIPRKTSNAEECRIYQRWLGQQSGKDGPPSGPC